MTEIRLTHLRLKRYKSFREATEVELRPLTVLLGRNGSGKSVLTRLVPQLMAALTTRREVGLDLDVGDIHYGRTFPDLIYNRHPNGSLEVGLSLEYAGKRHYLDWSIQSVFDRPDRGFQLVQHFEARDSDGWWSRLEWVSAEQELAGDPRSSRGIGDSSYQPKYRIDGSKQPDPPEPVSIAFAGLRPTGCPTLQSGHDSARQLEVETALNLFAEEVCYLGPVRSPVPAIIPSRTHDVRRVGVLGQDAPHVLRTGRDEALEAVRQFFRQSELGGWEFRLESQGSAFQLVLRRKKETSLLSEVGLGMTQVFPVVVQRAIPANVGPRAVLTPVRLEIVEEPESHLHPAAHAVVADLYVSGVQAGGVQFLVETHSEMFVLRLRRRVAEGKLDPSLVRLYWIDEDSDEEGSTLVPVNITESGDVDNWPEGVFSYDYEEVLAMRRAQRRREV